jgi:hypothetical protein
MGVAMTIFVYTSVPETSGKSLEEMDALFGSTNSLHFDGSQATMHLENMTEKEGEPRNAW